MTNLKSWLSDQGLSVREFALELDVPLKTAQDWVYRGVAPSVENRNRLVGYISSSCRHHWVIGTANGPTSNGVCQRCGHQREFQNSPGVSEFTGSFRIHRHTLRTGLSTPRAVKT